MLKRSPEMSYGHRLNVEQIYYSLAEERYRLASDHEGWVRHEDAVTCKDLSFRGYPKAEGLAHASIAVVSYATALEAFVNLVWNSQMLNKLPKGKIQEMVMKQLSTPEKAKELFKASEINLGERNWWTSVVEMYRVRNRLVHFREQIVYQGFSFASPTAIMLSAESVSNFRASTQKCIALLGEIAEIETPFLDGTFEFETVYA